MRQYRRYYAVGVRRWTESAKQCYLRGCICGENISPADKGANLTPQICVYKEILGDKCRMKETVIELVRRYGPPKGVKERTVLNEEDISERN